MYLSLSQNRSRLLATSLVLALLILALAFALAARAAPAAPGDLTVDIVAGYNLVVDSNVESPSTYAPSVATVMGEFCNDGGSTLTDVQGFIGDASAGTPGLYPSRDASASAFLAEHPALDHGGSYAFSHVGGQLGLADASRYLGSLAPGECKVQYWHFSYPQCENSPGGAADYPPCAPGNNPTWGDSVKPEDDLWLTFDVWGQASDGGSTISASKMWRMTTRNEISAMANKIRPNPDGTWFNTDADVVRPGDVITSNGILYELGNVNKGFDNDGNYAYDYNAWLQPIGDPAFDPTCFRLIKSSGVLTVSRSSGNPDTIVPFTNQLYFTGLPQDNNGVRGKVTYTFLALDGPCSAMLTPYQEVASGADNEKFNGDYGLSLPPVGSTEPTLTLDKSGDVSSVSADGTGEILYTVPFGNQETDLSKRGLGLPLLNMPLVISDSIPVSTTYIAGSADYNLSYAGSADILFSTDGGSSWSSIEPPAADVTTIQWRLREALPSQESGSATFRVGVDNDYDPPGTASDAFVENCADSRFGGGVAFQEACEVTLVEGDSSIGDFVWRDLDTDGFQDGGAETGIDNVTVSLYWDQDGDGEVDSGDTLLATQETAGGGAYDFTLLPSGSYVVVVDENDLDLPAGYGATTGVTHAVTLSAGGTDYNAADFGFGPILALTKSLVNGELDGVANDNIYEGQLVTYQLDVINTRPGGTGPGNTCQYPLWADQALNPGGSNTYWADPSRAEGRTDGAYAVANISNNPQILDLDQFGALAPRGALNDVTLTLYLKEITDLNAGDTLEVTVSSDGASDTFTFLGTDFTAPVGTVYAQALNSWTNIGWSWSSFAATNPTPPQVSLSATKGIGAGGSQLGLDAASLVVTTDEVCGDPAYILNPVPVSDSYDPNRLAFVSATPSVSAHTPGTLTWNNVGPLAAGEVRSLAVTFRALAPVTAPEVVTNVAATAGAKYVSGREANEASDSVDADLFSSHTIGDLVWFDADGNGVPDPGEPGLDGVLVELYLTGNRTVFYNGQVYGQGDLLATTATAAGGAYTFSGVPGSGANTDDYQVVVDEGGSPVLNGLASTTGGNSSDVANLGADDLDNDFGYNGSSIVYGTIWHDANADADDSGESPIAGVTVRLCLDPACTTVVGTTTSHAAGGYQFANVADGSYYVVVTPPGAQVAQPAGEDTAETCGLCNNTFPVVVSNALDSVYGGYDFGYTGADIGDTLFLDWDGDGLQDAAEEGIPNVTVTLFLDLDGDGLVDAGDTLLETRVTDGDGTYLFPGYPAGSYLVIVDGTDPDFPAGYPATADPDGTLDGRHAFTTGGVTPKLDVDFGYRPVGNASIGDRVWYDTDGDGVQDAGEIGLSAITVTLYEDGNGNGQYDPAVDALAGSSSTGAGGSYLFPALPAATYLVDVDTSDGDLPLDGDGNRILLSTANDPHPVALVAGQAYRAADFGFSTGGVVGDLLWQDNNADGSPGILEPGIMGVDVLLYVDGDGNGLYDAGSDTLYAGDTTGAGGLYQFSGLPAGDYVVVVDTSTLPAGFSQTGDPDASTICEPSDSDGLTFNDCDGESGVPLAAGQIDRSRDFGYRPSGIVGDFVWLDGDGDGAQDAGESGIGGVRLTLTLQTGAILTTTTDVEGYYYFGDLPDGTHTVTVDTASLPAGMTLVQSGDPDGSLDNTGTATLSGGSTDLTLDFGYRLDGPYAISGIAFFDEAADGGDWDGSEPVYPGMPIYLWQAGRLLASTSTDAGGFYRFANLPEGDYVVSTSAEWPGLYGATHTTTNPDGNNNGQVYEFVTVAGADVANVDFGFFGELGPTAVSLSQMAVDQPAPVAGWLLALLLLLGLAGAGLRQARRAAA